MRKEGDKYILDDSSLDETLRFYQEAAAKAKAERKNKSKSQPEKAKK